MANCYEPGVPKKFEHEQPVGNMDVHNNVQLTWAAGAELSVVL